MIKLSVLLRGAWATTTIAAVIFTAGLTATKAVADDAPCPILQNQGSSGCGVKPTLPPTPKLPPVVASAVPTQIPSAAPTVAPPQTATDQAQLFALSASYVSGSACVANISTCTDHYGVFGQYALVGYYDGNQVAGFFLAYKNGGVWQALVHGGGWLTPAEILMYAPNLGNDGATALENQATPIYSN